MSRSSSRLHRRWFLAGAGGALLPLPLLGSLFSPGTSEAQALREKCFGFFYQPHGNAYQRDMYPSQATLTNTMAYAGHTIRNGALVGNDSAGEMRVSEVLRAPSTRLSQALVAKMNVLMGLDVPFYQSHNTGMALGNFGDNQQGIKSVVANGRRPTLDQILAWSPTFYSDASRVVNRSVVLGDQSFAHANPKTRVGPIEMVGKTAQGSRDLFDQLFNTTTGPREKLLIDKTLANYTALRNGNQRLSSGDKRRLDDHIESLYELQRKLIAATSGTPPPRPATNSTDLSNKTEYSMDPALQVQAYQLWNDVIVAAFSTGTSRVISTSIWDASFTTYPGSAYGGSWHQEVAHKASIDAAAYTLLLTSYRTFFADVFVDLAKKLDAVDRGGGTTLLDDCLLFWTHESGHHTHDPICVPVVTFGSAAGGMKTGQFCDYRDLTRKMKGGDDLQKEDYEIGLLWHQWLGSVFQALGIPKSEYEVPAENGGYPNFHWQQTDYYTLVGGEKTLYPDSVWNVTGEMLPWLGP
ncbi:MAG: DUF1552 domain-containing protein [Polyangiaceae bacterium]|nr:DUF1552 domain-containing protein [Polyangiaceae bacterium]